MTNLTVKNPRFCCIVEFMVEIMALGQRMRHVRQGAGLTLEELSGRLGIVLQVWQGGVGLHCQQHRIQPLTRSVRVYYVHVCVS